MLPVLIEALQQEDEVICRVAADCLGDMGAEANEDVPALQQALAKPFKAPLIRMGLALALERIDPNAASSRHVGFPAPEGSQ